MEAIIQFMGAYGLPLTLIALLGIVALGLMKYGNAFRKIEEGHRHYIYLAITVGFSLAATAIYLAVVGAFEWNYFLAVSGAIFALNQTFYNVFKVTPVKDLFTKVCDYTKSWLVGQSNDKTGDE